MNGPAAMAVPRASVTFGVLAAVMFLIAGSAPETLVFDREAIGDGEVWRLVTGHLAHTDASHLAANLLGLGLLGVLFERHPARWGLLFGISAAAIDAWLWTLRPDIGRYCGLSGVLYGLLAAGLVARWQEGGQRWLLAAVAAAATAKLGLEFASGGGIVKHTAWPVLPGAHLAGAAAGVMAVLIMRTRT
ncbi:membrane protein [Sulfurifustis variabilis]|uniref:Membrane protein n=1 Tax=Sulfurifustis variabilis TaxID=1675686 RepID=A0A1C7AFV1_9GAMM|nr:rhombosortase [Sulfurifustis variabilis]BAU50286.1 membrane protein [Sulfurifustis variabilis]